MAHYPFQTFLFVWSAYVLLSGIFLVLFLVLFPKYFYHRFEVLIATKKGRSFLVTSMIAAIGVSFFLFKVAFGFYEFNVAHTTTGVLALGAFLVFPLTVLKWVDKEPISRMGEEVDEVEESLDLRVSISKKEGAIDLGDVVYIFSEKNYVVWVCLKEDQCQELRARETLSSVEERLAPYATVKRCHRAYLVNTHYVNKVLRSGSTFQLQLSSVNERIPLSRKLVGDFRN